jgi:hypothetical protein
MLMPQTNIPQITTDEIYKSILEKKDEDIKRFFEKISLS